MPSRTLPGIGLNGFWALGESGWKPGVDTNWLTLSALTQLSVVSRTTVLPVSPTDGDIYIVRSDAAAEPNKVAVRDNGAWVYLTPQEGWRAWVRDTDELVVFDGTSWVVSGGGLVDGSVTNSKLADMATARIKGRTAAGTGSPEDLTGTQVTEMLDTFTSGAKGLVPASGGGTTNFLRADGTWAAPSGGGGGALTVNTRTANYTLALGDAGAYVRMNLAGANTLTVPTNTTVAFPIGTVIHLRQTGAGQTTVSPFDGTVTINTPETSKLRKQGSSASLIKVGTNEWDLTGDLELI